MTVAEQTETDLKAKIEYFHQEFNGLAKTVKYSTIDDSIKNLAELKRLHHEVIATFARAHPNNLRTDKQDLLPDWRILLYLDDVYRDGKGISTEEIQMYTERAKSRHCQRVLFGDLVPETADPYITNPEQNPVPAGKEEFATWYIGFMQN